MSKGPYSQFITTRHYQLAIRELFIKPKKVLPQLFNYIAKSADIETLQFYSETILNIKPDGIITPLDIFNYQSLLTIVRSGNWDRFKWMFDNYKFISLIYSKELESTIFNNASNLQYFIGDVILSTDKNHSYYSSAKEVREGLNQIIDWLLFSRNTRDDKTYQDWAMNLGFYNTRDKLDYKPTYITAVLAENWNLAQQILTKLIPPGDIQTGRDILQPSLKAGMVAANKDFIDFILAVDSANGEWLPQGRVNNFTELENIITSWNTNDGLLAPRVELLTWYLQKYFNKYSPIEQSLSNEELGIVIDFTINIVGYITPELWQVLTHHFKMNNNLKRYNLYAKKRLIAALNTANLAMSKLLLEEYLIISEQSDSEDWVIHIPSDTLISICSSNNPDNLDVLKWLWSQKNNIKTDWDVVYSSANKWIYKYYNIDYVSKCAEIITWIWYNICMLRNTTYELTNKLLSDNFMHIHILSHPKIIKLITHWHPTIIPRLWKMATTKYSLDICEYLLTVFPDIIRVLPFPYENYFRDLFSYTNFSCWMIEVFPNTATRLSADIALELITHQYGFYKNHAAYLPRLLALFPIDGNISQQSNYIFHYANQNMDAIPEWRQVLYKICQIEPDKYSVILDSGQPNSLALAHFEIVIEYIPRAVSQIEQCPICQFADSRIITSCGHQFCAPCINKWLAEKKNCPYCRTQNPELFRAQITATTVECD